MANKVVKKTKSKIKRESKKLVKNNVLVCAVLLVILALSVLGGFFTIKIVCKNDEFSLVGEKEIVLKVGATYTESGAKLIEFGKDKSALVKIIGEVNTSEVGVYQLEYVIDSGRFKNVKRIRTIFVENAND